MNIRNVLYKWLNLDIPKIVCLCGSTKFRDQFVRENFRLTKEGIIVLSIGCDAKSEEHRLFITEEDKIKLDILHKKKIDISDEIFVLNVGGYIGESTRSEIEHAYKQGIDITYLEH